MRDTVPDQSAPLSDLRKLLVSELSSRGLSAETVRAYAGDFLAFLDGLHLQSMDAVPVDHRALHRYIRGLSEGSAPDRLSTSTVRRRLTGIRRCYSVLVERGVVEENPADRVKQPEVNSHATPRVQLLTLDDVMALLAAPDLSNPTGIRDRAIMTMIFALGLRVHEIHKLNVEDVNIRSGVVMVHGDGSSGTRLLAEPYRPAVKHWLTTRAVLGAGKGALFQPLTGSKGSGSDERLSARSIRKRVDRYLRLIGAKEEGVSCDALRMTGAAMALEHGAEMGGVRSQFGLSRQTLSALSGVGRQVTSHSGTV